MNSNWRLAAHFCRSPVTGIESARIDPNSTLLGASVKNASAWTRPKAWLLVNCVGAGLFLVVAARTAWVEPELRDTPGAAGVGGLLWMLGAFPIAAVFLLLNVVAAGYALVRLTVRRPPLPMSTWLSIPIWLMVLALDYQHRGI